MNYQPIGEVVTGAELVPLPAGVVPLDAVVLIKALSEDGHVQWHTRYTKDLTTVETLGAIRTAQLLEEQRVLALYTPDDD